MLSAILKLLHSDFNLIEYKWYFKIKSRIFFTRKIRIGFGPITTGENDLAERKWRIDPIVDEINRNKNAQYTAGFFVKPNEMTKFDIIVIVKKFASEYIPIIRKLKSDDKLFIYDIVDNPNAEKKYGTYFGKCRQFSSLMDGFILSSPLHEFEAKKFSDHYVLIEHPVISQLYKNDYSVKPELKILAHGYYENIKNIKMIEPIIRDISIETGIKIKLVYHTEVIQENTEWVQYVKWTAENCFKEIIDADIAVVIKNLHKRHQRDKPSTKLITFMAAGLPVICTPSIADRLVMRHKVDGYFAYTKDDWRKYITLLATESGYRQQVGKSARAAVYPRYSIPTIASKYMEFFDNIRKLYC